MPVARKIRRASSTWAGVQAGAAIQAVAPRPICAPRFGMQRTTARARERLGDLGERHARHDRDDQLALERRRDGAHERGELLRLDGDDHGIGEAHRRVRVAERVPGAEPCEQCLVRIADDERVVADVALQAAIQRAADVSRADDGNAIHRKCLPDRHCQGKPKRR